MTADVQRYAIRVHGFALGVVTEFNGKPITDRETAEAVARSIALMYDARCSIEAVVLSLPVAGQNGGPT